MEISNVSKKYMQLTILMLSLAYVMLYFTFKDHSMRSDKMWTLCDQQNVKIVWFIKSPQFYGSRYYSFPLEAIKIIHHKNHSRY